MEATRYFKLALVILITVGCSQKNSRVQRPSGLFSTVNEKSYLVTEGVLDTIEQQARMITHGDYLYAFGTGAGFGIYNTQSNEFVGDREMLDSRMGGINIAWPNGFSSIKAIVHAQDSLFVSSGRGLVRLLYNQPVTQTANGYRERYRLYGNGPSYNWNSAVYIPGTNWILGFRDSKMYRLDISKPDQEPSEINITVSGRAFNLSCGRGAAYYQGKVYVAGCTRLIEVSAANGNWASAGTYVFETLDLGMNPLNVVATENYLYVQHRRTGGRDTSDNAPGIYVFDEEIQEYEDAEPVLEIFLRDSRLTERQAITFTVSSDDTLLFANIDNRKINVFEIP